MIICEVLVSSERGMFHCLEQETVACETVDSVSSWARHSKRLPLADRDADKDLLLNQNDFEMLAAAMMRTCGARMTDVFLEKKKTVSRDNERLD